MLQIVIVNNLYECSFFLLQLDTWIATDDRNKYKWLLMYHEI